MNELARLDTETLTAIAESLNVDYTASLSYDRVEAARLLNRYLTVTAELHRRYELRTYAYRYN